MYFNLQQSHFSLSEFPLKFSATSTLALEYKILKRNMPCWHQNCSYILLPTLELFFVYLICSKGLSVGVKYCLQSSYGMKQFVYLFFHCRNCLTFLNRLTCQNSLTYFFNTYLLARCRSWRSHIVQRCDQIITNKWCKLNHTCPTCEVVLGYPNYWHVMLPLSSHP